MNRLRLAVLAAILVCACGGVYLARHRRPDPDRLRHFVLDECVPHQLAGRDPDPCALVDLSRGQGSGFVIFYESSHRTQYLAMPTTDITGIEDPALLRPDAPNLFAAAWANRTLVADRLHHPLTRDDYSLAINSRASRTQNLAHIHIDCLRSDVRDSLRADRLAIGSQWTAFPDVLAGHRYRALRLSEADLQTLDPFKRLAASLGDPASEMGDHTLVLVGEDFPEGPGFLLLDDRVDRWRFDFAGGESLQDHGCKIGRAS